MKKYLLFFVLLAGTVTDLLAQRILLEQDVSGDSIMETYGPNRKHFGHFYMGFGFVAGPAEASSSDVDYFKSHEVLFGYRYKYRVSNFYALGFETTFGTQTFEIKQHAGKGLPSPFVNNDKE